MEYFQADGRFNQRKIIRPCTVYSVLFFFINVCKTAYKIKAGIRETLDRKSNYVIFSNNFIVRESSYFERRQLSLSFFLDSSPSHVHTAAFNACVYAYTRCIGRHAASAFRVGINLISPAFNRPVRAASSGEFNLDFDLPLRLVERLSDYLTFSITRTATSNVYRSTSILRTDPRYP